MFPRIDCLNKNTLRVLSLKLLSPNQRHISTAEIATALRPFYFAVHPDLFGRHPKERAVNEESLKHLSVHLEALKQRRLAYSVPNVLKFYIRTSDGNNRDSFRLIRVAFGATQEPKAVIKSLLESCNLSTEYVEKIKTVPYSGTIMPQGDINYGSDFNNYEASYNMKAQTKKKHLEMWLDKNISVAHTRNQDLVGLQEEVSKLQKSLASRLNIKEFRYDCGWNYEHFRGCLKTLERLANMHTKDVQFLKDRIVVFAPFTGISLEGHVMLFTGDVPNNWLDFIKHIPAHDSYLGKIPLYEHALSQVLRNIKIAKRKFMPKQQVVQYAAHLTKVTTTLLDYLTTQSYPDTWPSVLSDFEIVIESESGPLMVNPTGQFIAPSTCPGTILVDFITNNLEDAKAKSQQYQKSKTIEKDLYERCINELQLKSLTKDDSVTPDNMIQALERLLSNSPKHLLADVHLNITNYYSVLTDGTVCIPWDFSTN